MNDLLSQTLTQIPIGGILVATQGRGRLQNQPGGYTFVQVTYNGQTGWIYAAEGVSLVNNSGGSLCNNLPLVRLDYQVPSSTSPSALAYDYNADYQQNCQVILPSKPQQAQCVYDRFLDQFLQTFNRFPTMKELLGTTVQAEWWAYKNAPPEAGSVGKSLLHDASEGLSRAYFSKQNCTHSICTTASPLANFLSGYQPWLIQSTASDAASALIGDYKNVLRSGRPGIPDGVLTTQTVEDIFNPSPGDPTGTKTNSNWATQGQCNRPWQWFTFPSHNGSGRQFGTASTQVYDRFLDIPQITQSFEIFTLAQTLNSHGLGC